MNPTTGLRLKQKTDWFPAGQTFLEAMKRVSDGAFKLFAYVCLKAERRTASYRARSDELAAALGKSPKQVISHILEMERAGLCVITSRETAYATVRISEEYWPYLYDYGNSEVGAGSDYVATIRDTFLALGCTHGRFGASEESQVLKLQKRNIPLRTVQEALMIGACRKYVSWLNNGYSEPISSIQYFEPIIEEIRTNPLPAGYRDFLPLELRRLSGHVGVERPKARVGHAPDLGLLLRISHKKTQKTKTTPQTKTGDEMMSDTHSAASDFSREVEFAVETQ